MEISLETYKQHVRQLSLADEVRLSRLLDSLIKRRDQGLPFDKKFAQFENSFAVALDKMIAKQRRMPSISFPEALPISQKRDEIAQTVESNQVVVLAGETGSGKTTQIPKICLSLGRGLRGQIGHTQPRRIAARTVASRIAEELQAPLGSSVGYQVRFDDHTDDNTFIKLMTDGVLLAEIQRDPLLMRYDTLIVDEAHERSLNIDFLLGYLKQLLPKRPDLKLIVTSATIDLERFSSHFNNAPIVEVSGRTYDVKTFYRPWQGEHEDINDAIVSAIDEILTTQKRGDILVFLSGEREIREASVAIKKADFKHLQVLPLYARLSIAEQNKIFHGHRGQRVVLATNVAETSITVPGIKYVIDPGYARVSRYSIRTKVQRLPVEAVSQASANQRKGRCGRVSEGICYRLYDEDDFNNRAEFTDPEITRTNLAAVILQMLHMRIGDIRDFPFIDSPERRLINDGFKLLEEVGAVRRNGELTQKAKLFYQLPIDPRLAAVIVESEKLACLHEILIIVAALSIQDPRERPADKQQAADEKHRRFWDEHSDFIAYLNLWRYFELQRQELSQSQLRKLCQKEFINYLRMREWRELHHQLKLAARNLGFKENKEEASYQSIHSALLSGYLSLIGLREQEKGSKEYHGTRQKKFMVFPGSSQAKKKHKWLVAAQYIETRQLFAHCVAKIEPEWVLQYADHLSKKHYSEPHYDVKSGQVNAFVRTTLFGLILQEKTRVSYKKIAPKQAWEIFIREALVEGKYRGKGEFFVHNQRVVEEVHLLEAKSRRRDIMVDDEVVVNFYQNLVPEHITNLAGFEHWRRKAEEGRPGLLLLKKDQLMLHDADHVSQQQFPDEMRVGDYTFPVSYRFEPGKVNDGINLIVPVELLHEIQGNVLEWVVPGVLRDKCIALVKGLPKRLRKSFVPVPDFVDKVLPRLKVGNVKLVDALGEALGHITQVKLTVDDWDENLLDDFFRINIIVVDDHEKVIDQSRDLEKLRVKYRERVKTTLSKIGEGVERKNITAWDFGTLSDSVVLNRGNVTVKAYPALVDENQSVALKILDNPLESNFESYFGVLRLASIECGATVKYLKRGLMKGKDIGLALLDIGNRAKIVDDIILAAIDRAIFDGDSLPSTEKQFHGLIEKGRSSIVMHAESYEMLFYKILTSVVEIKKSIRNHKNPLSIAMASADINAQLSALLYPGFLYKVPRYWLEQYPRYLSAICMRLDKVGQNPHRDAMWAEDIKTLWEKHENRLLQEGVWGYFHNPQWQKYRWMIDELRVSLFAQTLKTLMPVSVKRLQKQWDNSF